MGHGDLAEATDRFRRALATSHAAKDRVLEQMSRLDREAASRSERVGTRIGVTVGAAGLRVLGLAITVALLSSQEVTESRNLLQRIIDTVPARVFWKDRDLHSDITLIKEQEQTLQHVAHYDVLTGLPNRVLLADRLRQGMAQAQRHGRLLAVAFLDLDGFKAINDRHGHAAGDHVLIAAAAGMQQVLREGDTLAPTGGDEFVAALLDLADIQASVPLLARLLAAAAQSVPWTTSAPAMPR